MISYIRGELAEIGENHVVIDVGGVGYGIFMSGSDMSSLPKTGQEVKIHTYLHVKEDLMQLFGFLTKDGLEVFKLIIGVSGIDLALRVPFQRLRESERRQRKS